MVEEYLAKGIEASKEHKYDEFLPDSLLRERTKIDLLDWKESLIVLRRIIDSIN